MAGDRGGAGRLTPAAVAQETPRQPEVVRLLRLADDASAALYPPQSRHPLDVEALTAANVHLFVARADGRAVGCGALVIDGTGGEIKRMIVEPAARGHGVGRLLLRAVEDAAACAGVTVLRLETGVASTAALALYRRCGYRERGPFGAYRPDPLSVFMEKRIGHG